MKKSNVLEISILLFIAIIIIPFVALRYDTAPTAIQKDALITMFKVCMAVALVCFAVSEWTRNYSQVDKLWSMLPVIYTGISAYYADWSPKLLLIFSVVLIWGLRLTYNFSRRGGYRLKFWEGEEDYRWSVLRQDAKFNTRLRFGIFNLFFISIYQNILILLFAIPSILCIGNDTSVSFFDIILSLVIVCLVIYETVADQQQWNFQTHKYNLMKNNKPLSSPYSAGFIKSGLWRFSRHPNYFAEQSIWIVFYFFSVSATGRWLNWTAIGAILLMLLFQGSANFSEGISSAKYPEYDDYCNKTSKFIPVFWKKSN